MELENAVTIDLGKIELLAVREPIYIDNHKEIKFKINWCRLKDNPEVLIRFNIDFDTLSNEIREKNIEYIDIREITKCKLKEIVEKELNSFIGKNINNISYFFEREERSDANEKYYIYPEFFDISEIGISILENEDSIENRTRNITTFDNFNEIEKCKLKYKNVLYGVDVIEVDLKETKILTENSKIISVLYSNDKLKKILAYKQYELGITPDFYNEIAKINEFLKDKKTVTVILKNGHEKKIEANIKNFMKFYDGIFILDGYGLEIPSEERNKSNLNINNLKSLRYGKTELIINTENLRPLDEQLTEIINKNDRGIICEVNEPEKEIENE